MLGFFLLKSPGTSATAAVTLPLEPVLLADTPISPRGQFSAEGEQKNMTNVYPGNKTNTEEAEGGNILAM